MHNLNKNKWIIVIVIITCVFVLVASLFIFKSIQVTKNFIRYFLTENYNNNSLKNENISSIPDDELVYEVMNWMWSKVGDDWSHEYEIISELPKPCQDIYSVYIIEGEVNNGGFNQCYYNSSREFTVMAESGFKAIGAEGFADIMIRANIMYSQIKDNLEKYKDGTLEGFSKSYENNPLNLLDDEFYIMYDKEPLDKLCVDYIRENSEYFGN